MSGAVKTVIGFAFKTITRVGPFVWAYYQVKRGVKKFIEGIPTPNWLEIKFPDTSSISSAIENKKASFHLPFTGRREAEALEIAQREEEIMEAKKKKKWTFLKVIIVLGILIAIAIYVLDKLLPKPYDEDDFDDAWDDDDAWDTDEEEEEAVRPPAADGVNEDLEEDAEEEEKDEEKEGK